MLQEKGTKLPTVVGGAALEIYALGQYMSHDIDIKSDFETTMFLLRSMGFRNEGRSLMYSEEFDILVDWQGASLEEGVEAENRVMRVAVSDDHQPVQLLSLEDLIIDRLEACKYGKDKDSLGWAKALYTLGQRNSLRLDETHC